MTSLPDLHVTLCGIHFHTSVQLFPDLDITICRTVYLLRYELCIRTNKGSLIIAVGSENSDK